MRHTISSLTVTAFLAAFAVVPVWGQTAGSVEDGDSPDHAVARVSLINGEVSVAHDNNDMVAAAPNAPMVTGDRILTGDNARAEVQFDSANLLRMAAGTEVRMGDLQYHRYLVQVAQGLVVFRVLQDTDAQVEISTPGVSLHPRRQGVYRILVRPDGSSELTVRAGDAEIFAPTGSEPLGAGQSIVSRGSANDPEFQNVNPPAYDEFDRWSGDRDRVFERAAESSRYVSPDVYGTEELANYGRWSYDSDYGNVWIPTVDSDWVPYRQGRWSWVDYYGWSWVSYDPWGWAPYHYGRWYRGNYGWAWYPGAVGPRYYWRPALVSFFGWGSPGFGANFNFGFGNIGWVPLAPREIYRPWYGRWAGGRGNMIVNNTNIGNAYRNGRYPGAITSMRAGDFGRGAIRNNSGFVRANGNDLARAGVLQGSPFGPSREGRQFVSRDVNMRGMPRTNENMRFFSSSRQNGFAGGGPGNGGAGNAGFGNAPAQDRGGFRRFDSGAPNGNPGGTAQPRQDSGFRRFDAGAPRNDNSGFNSPRSDGFRGFNQPGQRNDVPRNDVQRNDAPRNDMPRSDNFGQGGFRRFGGNGPGNGNEAGAFRGDVPRTESPRVNAPQGNAPGYFGGRQQGMSNQGMPNQGMSNQGMQGQGMRNNDAPRMQAPQRTERGTAGGFGGGSFGSPREQQPVRIAPPIVNRGREEFRGAPQSGGQGFGGARPNFGGGSGTPRGGGNGGGFRGGSGGGSGAGNNSGGGQRGGGGVNFGYWFSAARKYS
ncbi:MAG: DUF6600 domain-containing protein, partial [Bryobacteraceae bacterium]